MNGILGAERNGFFGSSLRLLIYYLTKTEIFFWADEWLSILNLFISFALIFRICFHDFDFNQLFDCSLLTVERKPKIICDYCSDVCSCFWAIFGFMFVLTIKNK